MFTLSDCLHVPGGLLGTSNKYQPSLAMPLQLSFANALFNFSYATIHSIKSAEYSSYKNCYNYDHHIEDGLCKIFLNMHHISWEESLAVCNSSHYSVFQDEVVPF